MSVALLPLFGPLPDGAAWPGRCSSASSSRGASRSSSAWGVGGAVVVGLLYAVAGRDHPPPDVEERYGGRE